MRQPLHRSVRVAGVMSLVLIALGLAAFIFLPSAGIGSRQSVEQGPGAIALPLETAMPITATVVGGGPLPTMTTPPQKQAYA